MSFMDGFVLAVPTANKEKFIEHAKKSDSAFMEVGALRVVECWGEDVPAGKVTDFRRAVQAGDDETVVFSWIEWPDKATRDAAMGHLTEMMQTDDRFNPEKNPWPFDGKRLIFGGFAPLLELPASKPAPGIQPYLFFRGRCEEAIAYYQANLGAEVLMQMRFKDNPDRPSHDKVPAELDNRIMHAALRINGSEIMMSDGMSSGPLDFQCMSLSLAAATPVEARGIFDALAKDGVVQMPLGPTFFSPCFGAVTDKFGVAWMVIVHQQPA